MKMQRYLGARSSRVKTLASKFRRREEKGSKCFVPNIPSFEIKTIVAYECKGKSSCTKKKKRTAVSGLYNDSEINPAQSVQRTILIKVARPVRHSLPHTARRLGSKEALDVTLFQAIFCAECSSFLFRERTLVVDGMVFTKARHV